MLQNFTYSGPNSAITLVLADRTEQEIILWTGGLVNLPDDHEAVMALVAQGWLSLVAPAAAAKPAAAANPANPANPTQGA